LLCSTICLSILSSLSPLPLVVLLSRFAFTYLWPNYIALKVLLPIPPGLCLDTWAGRVGGYSMHPPDRCLDRREAQLLYSSSVRGQGGVGATQCTLLVRACTLLVCAWTGGKLNCFILVEYVGREGWALLNAPSWYVLAPSWYVL